MIFTWFVFQTAPPSEFKNVYLVHLHAPYRARQFQFPDLSIKDSTKSINKQIVEFNCRRLYPALDAALYGSSQQDLSNDFSIF
jgi:hypothetical protein